MVRAAWCILLACATGGWAQSPPRSVAQADSALAAGDLALADSLYYIGPRLRPRDPQMREALGRYLAAQGRTKVAIVLLEESRMFGGDPARIAQQLVPLYERVGDWRALLTLTRSPLTTAERRRVGWLADNPYEAVGEGGSAALVPGPLAGDTIARVAVRIAGRSAVAAVVGTDVGIIIGSRLAAGARRFDGDSTIVGLDSLSIGSLKLFHIPARIGDGASSMVIGVAALPRLIAAIDYGTGRITFAKTDDARSEQRAPLFRSQGELRFYERGRWYPISAIAAIASRAKQTLVVDPTAGEVRLRK